VKEKLAAARRGLKREFDYYRRVAKHPDTPRSARILLSLAIGYALLAFDLIPDFIPVIGHLDDAIIIPGLVLLALRVVPKEILKECRSAAKMEEVEIRR
jgi:uncharacterized membrane protein YkvA (DUF1232 family)